VTKLLLLAIALIGLADSAVSERSAPPLLIDNRPATATLDANH
jgi:hypothetical protein